VGLIERIQASRTEQRVIGGVPWRPWDSPYWKFDTGGPVHPSRAMFGTDRALGLPALYSGVRLLAESAAALPLKLYTRANDNRTHRYSGPSIFDKPSADGTIFDWIFTAMTSLLLQGNAWGFITGTDGYGYPSGIEWIPPEDVICVNDEMQPWNPMRTRIYVYGRLMDRRELFHVKAFSLAGRTEGISVLRAFAATILSGLEAERYGTDWYLSGGFPTGTFQNTEIEINEEQAAEIRSVLLGSLRQRSPLVYGRDWDYKPVIVPPSEAQFIEALRMNATMVASVLGLPPDRIGGTRGDSLTYNTVEQSTLQVIEALRPWLVRLETAFYDLLPSNRYVRFNSDALLKTDLKTRTEIYQMQRAIGMRSVDEIRDTEDMEPLPGGQGNENIPLDVMVAMARSIRGIPKSMLNQTVLEMDLAADKLEELEKEGLAQPDIPGQPVVPSSSSMLGQVIGSQRHYGGSREEREDADLIWNFLQARQAALRAQARKQADGPEFVGAWIPSRRDLVMSGSGGNGNGLSGH
jgi:HK97 family phage portal protein